MLKKKFSNTDILQKSFYRKMICKKSYYPILAEFLNRIDDFIEASQEKFFKNKSGETTTVAVLSVADRRLVIKRYNFRNFFHGLKLRFRGSRAMRSWQFAHRLQAFDIATPNPIAVIEERWGPLRGRAYYITEYIEGIRGCEYFADNSHYQQQWPQSIVAIVQLTLKLRAHGFTHKDYHFGNLIMKNNQPVLVDLDNMQQHSAHSRRFQQRHQKDLANFRWYLCRNNFAQLAFKQYQQHQIF